jgi:glycosyltransferase involved in cell wall biosynthesis
MKLSVVVPVRNGEDTIGDCLASLLRADLPSDGSEIVVVDNGSTDATAEIVRRHPVRYVHEERRGLSQARNRAIAESRGEIIAFTDADCVVTGSWPAQLVEGFGERRVWVVAGEVLPYPPATPAERYAARRKPHWQRSVLQDTSPPSFLFSSLAVRREAFDRVGVFDPRFSVVGCEDVDWSWRFFAAGLSFAYRPAAVVLHRHRRTARELFAQHFRIARGEVVLSGKHGSELGWGLRRELVAWADLVRGAGRLADPRQDSAHAYFDLVRKLGQRLGFLWESAAARR